MEGNWVDVVVYQRDGGQYSSERIVQGIGFDDQRGLGDTMGKYWSGGEGLL